eukprot:gene11603-4846_t
MGVGICLTDNPHCLQWSPFQNNLLAVSTSNRPGHTPISEFLPKNNIEIAHQIQMNIGTNQICWSHKNPNIVLTSCDDFMLRFFDLKNIDCMYREFYENQKVRTIDWDRISLEWILTAGSDEYVKLYNNLQEEEKSNVLIKHDSNVNDAHWCKNTPFSFTCLELFIILIFTACDQKGFVYLWDIKNNENTMKFKVENDTCGMKIDTNNFDEYSLALAGFDESIYAYDLRNPKKPKSYIKKAHISLITDLKYSPHTQHILASSSCDRTLRIWDMRPPLYNKDDDSFGGGISASLKPQKVEDF